jgi:GT2 family glycosyltransferase
MVDTIDCITSLKRIEYSNYHILVVDNGSTDGSVVGIKAAFPDIRLLETHENLGFADGNNRGIKLALEDGADYVLLLNNDTEVDSNFLSELVKAAESSQGVGIVGSKIYYYSEPKQLWFAGGRINFYTGDTHHIGERELDEGKYDRIGDTGYVSGCSMLIKRKVLEDIGTLDETFFLYYEDSDFCARARRHGYRIVYAPASVVWHKVSSTAGKVKDLQLFYGTRNMLIFEKRNAGLQHLVVFLPYYFGKFVLYNTIVAVVSGNFSRARRLLKAAYEGMTR